MPKLKILVTAVSLMITLPFLTGHSLASPDSKKKPAKINYNEFPTQADDIQILGNGWFTFKLKGECFLTGPHGISEANVCDIFDRTAEIQSSK